RQSIASPQLTVWPLMVVVTCFPLAAAHAVLHCAKIASLEVPSQYWSSSDELLIAQFNAADSNCRATWSGALWSVLGLTQIASSADSPLPTAVLLMVSPQIVSAPPAFSIAAFNASCVMLCARPVSPFAF